MKTILGFLSFMFIAAGVSGLLAHIFDWSASLFGFFRFAIPDGYEVYGYLILTVLGIAVAAAGNALKRNEADQGQAGS